MTDELTKENKDLRAQIISLIRRARDNEQKQNVYQKKELKFIKLESLSSLVEEATIRFEKDLNLQFVTLGVINDNNELERFLELDGLLISHLDRLISFDDPSAYNDLFKKNREPILGEFIPKKHSWLFPDHQDTINSLAIVPLIRRGKIIGSINMGSERPDRYKDIQSSHLLEHMASVLSVCLENILFFSRVEESSLKDPLTGLWNRRFFDERSKNALEKCIGAKPFSYMIIDIDNFKSINDNYGHDIGDYVLKEVADIARKSLYDYGALCRFGGEEFVIWLEESDSTNAYAIAEQVRKKIESHMFSLDKNASTFNVTVSIGVSTLLPTSHIEENEIIEKIMKQADECLYQAKNTGRNKVVNIEMQ